MVSDIWCRTTQIAREETCCCHMGYSFRLSARVLLNAPSHRQDSTYHGFVIPVIGHWLEWEIAQWVHHKGSIWQPIIPWVNALTSELHLAPVEVRLSTKRNGTYIIGISQWKILIQMNEWMFNRKTTSAILCETTVLVYINTCMHLSLFIYIHFKIFFIITILFNCFNLIP